MTRAELLPGTPAATRPPTRVLFLTCELAAAGIERRLLEFARHFPETTELHVCVIGEDLTLLEQFRRTRARVVVIPIRRAYLEWGQAWKVIAYTRKHDISIINSFDHKTLLVALAVKLWSRPRVQLVHHLVSLWDGMRSYQKQFMWHALRYADLVVCNGYAVKEYLIGSRALRPRVVVIPNGVDCEYFRPMPDVRLAERARQGFAHDQFVLGTVANVRSVKNYPLLLHTMRRVATRYPHVRLVCVGGGPQLAEMQDLARRLGLGDRVVFTGQVTDIRPWVATFDAFALCSFHEGCPNALMQAMAMEVASVSSNVGEVPHLTDSGKCGLLFEPTEEETCYAAVARLIEDDAGRARLASAGRARMAQHYSNEKMIDSYVSLFAAASTGQ